ncbi:MAG: sigma-70 family RNA polymerase sigma factor [Actinomycetota bacterium]|nr:sigma-70 family RNA polymerase sigma factor [Actinomycetota bacterium]MDQ3573735.1 sigma-70 family RNA polymerase sigma factor [Actinomycetota bacterium]
MVSGRGPARLSFGPDFHEVLTAAQQGAGWALTRLYEALAPALAGYLRAQGVRDFDDVTNEVFVVVLSRVQSFTGTEAQLRSWVFTIAYRRMVDIRRTTERRPEMDPLDTGVLNGDKGSRISVSAEDAALQHMGEARIQRLLASLSPEQRDVVALRILSDLSVEDVAAVVGKQPGAVKALQRRALAALRRTLSREAERAE